MLNILINKFGCGKLEKDNRKSVFNLSVYKFSDNYDIIIPFFTKYPVAGIKSLDFLDFKKVAELIKNKKHKTMESYKEIVKINSTMNDRRP